MHVVGSDALSGRPALIVRFTRAVVVAAVAVLAAVATAGPAGAHGEEKLGVQPAVVRPGDELSLSGQYLWTDQPITVRFEAEGRPPATAGSGTTGGDGTVELALRVPKGLPAGTYDVVAVNSFGESARAHVIVEAAPAGPTRVIALGAATVATLGLVALAASRRRNQSAEPTPAASTS